MVAPVDLVEVVRIGAGSGQVVKRRLWSGGELVAGGDCEPESGSGRSGLGDGVRVVEIYFDDREMDLEYWDPRSGGVLREATVNWGPGPVWWSIARRVLDAYAPIAGVPDATFFARFQLLGLALDPIVGFEVDIRLEDGFPVGAPVGSLLNHSCGLRNPDLVTANLMPYEDALAQARIQQAATGVPAFSEFTAGVIVADLITTICQTIDDTADPSASRLS